MNTLITRFCLASNVDIKGFDDGHEGRSRLLDAGFSRTYDQAYAAGLAVRTREQPELVMDDGAELRSGRGDIQ